MIIAQENQKAILARLQMSSEALSGFCAKWKIQEFALFGSVLRDDFSAESDIDVMVTFFPGHTWGLEFVEMADELEQHFHRKVDFVTRRSIEHSGNWVRRQNILETAQVIYARD